MKFTTQQEKEIVEVLVNTENKIQTDTHLLCNIEPNTSRKSIQNQTETFLPKEGITHTLFSIVNLIQLDATH